MYLHLDHIKDIADACREAELRKALRKKLESYHLDFLLRGYRDEILQHMHRFPLGYLRSMEPHFNGTPPSLEALRTITRDIALGRARRVQHNLSLEDRARQYLGATFNPYTAADFIIKKAEEHREQRTAGLTVVSFKAYQERIKTEREVAERLQDGVYFFNLLAKVAKGEVTSDILRAKGRIENKVGETRAERKKIEIEFADYQARMGAYVQQPLPLKP